MKYQLEDVASEIYFYSVPDLHFPIIPLTQSISRNCEIGMSKTCKIKCEGLKNLSSLKTYQD